MTPKLLLADDSVTIQRVIELTFADEDVEVLAVGDGQQAIERVKSDRPDIVLADVGMPERDGYEVAAFIKNDPQLAHIPVLLLTGAFEPVDEVRARAVGCDGVLVKPFEPQMVISRVRDLLAGNREAGSRPQTPVSTASAPLVVETGRHDVISAATEEPGGPNALEAYFDRLDAALANKTATPPAPEPIARPVPVARETPAVPVAPPVPPIPVATAPRPVAPAPAPPVAPPPPAPPQQVAPAPSVASPTPERVPLETSLQEAFAALLAAEHALPRTPSPTASAPATVSSETIEEICRRVIARMGDESMRAAVLDAAERLVREEIARIKSQA